MYKIIKIILAYSFLFILFSCTNNDYKYEEAKKHISELNSRDGLVLEIYEFWDNFDDHELKRHKFEDLPGKLQGEINGDIYFHKENIESLGYIAYWDKHKKIYLLKKKP